MTNDDKDEVAVLRRHQDRVLVRIQELQQRRSELRNELEKLSGDESQAIMQLRGLAMTIADITGEPLNMPTPADVEEDERLATRERAITVARQRMSRQALEDAERELASGRKAYVAGSMRRSTKATSTEPRDGAPAPTPPTADVEEMSGEMRQALMRRLRWQRLARTDAIVTLLQETGHPMSPSDMAEELRSRGRKDDTARLVSASLSHLSRQDRVVSAGHGLWVHPDHAPAARASGLFPEADGATDDLPADAEEEGVSTHPAG